MEVHADPNPGNFGVRWEGDQVQWVIYDFGAVHALDEETRLGLLLLLKMADDRKGDPFSLLVRLGFDRTALEPIRDNLLAFLTVLFEPFLSEGRFQLNTWNRSNRTRDLLGEHRYQFMIASPAKWIGLMRALQGFFHYSELLGAGVFLRKKLEQHFRRHAQAMTTFRESIEETPVQLSEHLHIQVREGSSEKVKVIFRADCVECLEELMEEETLKSLQDQGINLEDIKSKTRANGYRPMELFTQNVGEKTIRVFID
jgi:predicted unusual protein kinase regulating ubiquinone biosynthesis (AarF/ABC1/UbiB family)